MKTILFPGQGSQLRGMGGTLFDEFSELTRTASDVLGYSIKELCLEDPRRELNRTQFTQPAIYVVNALSYYRRTKDSGDTPAMFAGHSLGEFNALMSAGCFDFEIGLQLVKKRGELMGEVTGGGMAAIVNVSRDKITAILHEQNALGIDIAIHNAPLQSVIAGLKDDLTSLEPFFHFEESQFLPLNTSGAFHSRYMKSVSEEFRSYLSQVKFSPLQKPVIANVSARPYRDEEVVTNLVDQITHPVLWCESIQHLLSIEGMEFEEIGHGNVLTKLLHWIKTQTAPAENKVTEIPAEKKSVYQVKLSGTSNGETFPHHGANERQQLALKRVADWNAMYPIGTRVRSKRTPDKELETRTAALILFGHRAAVYLKGYNGYFSLDELQVTGTNV